MEEQPYRLRATIMTNREPMSNFWDLMGATRSDCLLAEHFCSQDSSKGGTSLSLRRAW